MRNLFLVLLLANLAFAAWQAWFASPSPGSVKEAHSPQIRLVSEVDTETPPAPQSAEPAGSAAAAPAVADRAGAQAAAAGTAEPAQSTGDARAEAGSPATPDPPVRRCVSVGPFRELSEAATATARLRTAGYEPTQRVVEGDIWVGYWVHIEGLSTRDEANQALSRLHGNGVTEAYLIPGELDGDIISLGVFSEISRAGRLRDQVRDLGFDPAVVDRTRRGTVYWVDVGLGPSQELDFETLQTPGRITRLEQRACELPGV
jgi:cell division septation protein DedD